MSFMNLKALSNSIKLYPVCFFHTGYFYALMWYLCANAVCCCAVYFCVVWYCGCACDDSLVCGVG